MSLLEPNEYKQYVVHDFNPVFQVSVNAFVNGFSWSGVEILRQFLSFKA